MPSSYWNTNLETETSSSNPNSEAERELAVELARLVKIFYGEEQCTTSPQIDTTN